MRILFLLTLLFPFYGHAANNEHPPIRLDIPVICNYGVDCHIQNYVDTDDSDDYHDYQCGSLTNNTHGGVDFRLNNFAALENNVKVIAARGGIVKGIRDGMEDVSIKDINPSTIENRKCGNGVLVTHDNGWETQYCHLKKGSINVDKGQSIRPGDLIGFVGLSGNTEFPHLEFIVRHNGKKIDPFASSNSKCTQKNRPTAGSLWTQEAERVLRYEPTALLGMGFSGHYPPDTKKVRYGEYNTPTLPHDAPVMIMWVDLMGPRKGDTVVYNIFGPDGKLMHEHTKKIEKTQALAIFYNGMKAQEGDWRPGTYTASFELLHKGNTIIREKTSIEVVRGEVKEDRLH